MGAVSNYTLQTFMADVKNEVANNNIQISSAEQADESIRQYFNNLAVHDNWENPEEYETDQKTYWQAVGNCVNNILAVVQDGADKITKSFWGGAKANGAQNYDVVDEFTNGERTKSTFGYDNNDDGQISGSEKEYEFTAGNYKTKKNGAIMLDTMNVYENGKLVETVEGYDKNEDGYLDGDEITYREDIDNEE